MGKNDECAVKNNKNDEFMCKNNACVIKNNGHMDKTMS